MESRFNNLRKATSDVRHPRRGNITPVTQKPQYFERRDWEPKKMFKLAPSFKRLKKISLIVVITLVASVGAYGIYVWASKGSSISQARSIYENLKLASVDLANLDTESANRRIKDTQDILRSLGLKTAPLKLAPVLRDVPGIVDKLEQVTEALSRITKNVEKLRSGGLSMLFGGSTTLAPALKEILRDLESLSEHASYIRNTTSKFVEIPEEASGVYVSLTADLQSAIDILDAFIAMLESGDKRHFLLAFQNPTEIRPAGGFVGSYGIVQIGGGSIGEIEVNDIYYPEHFSDSKIIPPLELQSITTRWGPQDANWFFDFPTSARKLTQFIEESSVYKEKNMRFEGAVAINVRLIEDIMKITGPIDIPDYGMVLTADNFLREVQREVETGRDKKPGHNPKKVLKFITPALINKVGNLNANAKESVLRAVGYRFQNKDMMLYFKDAVLENLARRYGVSGEISELTNDFTGDYLAIVNANVAGGKSDAFVAQKLQLNSKIDPLGMTTNSLKISRMHSGEKEQDWWYRATNQNYIKIFTLPGAKLIDINGNSAKTIFPPLNYEANGYREDPDLSSVESTRETIQNLNVSTYKESGKNVFGAWFSTPAGASKTLAVDYTNPKRVNLKAGLKYTFILEKQSGVESDLSYTIEAPIGFRWRESKSEIFRYETSKIPPRLKIDLTLEEEEF